MLLIRCFNFLQMLYKSLQPVLFNTSLWFWTGFSAGSRSRQVLSVPISNLTFFVFTPWSFCICWHWKGVNNLYIYIMVQPCVSFQRLITRVIHAFIHVFQHVEEILGYLQVCVKLEATKTLLCVQQVFINMLHHIFSYMSGQVFSSWRFRPSKSLPSPDRPHHDEFAPSIITCSPAPFPVCPQIYNSFSHSRTCSFIRREK